MTFQVLISTMHQIDFNIVKRMNIHSDAIIINQCERNDYKEFMHNGHKIMMLSFNERGVGLSRNNALMRADADICLFGDDDIIYVDNYNEFILQAFEKIPQADLIVFNIRSKDNVSEHYMNTGFKKLGLFNSMKYGTARLAIRTNSIKKANVYFSLLFGGGARYSAGEDTLFIYECLRKRLKLYACPYIIGETDDSTSTWFRGYNDKFLIDKGSFFACLSKKYANLLCLQFLLRHQYILKDKTAFNNAYKLMSNGICLFNNDT